MNLADRARLKGVMTFLLAHERPMHYYQRRPMQLTRLTWKQMQAKLVYGDTYSDCSETVTAIFKWAGCKDPSGRGFDGLGNTETMYDHLPHYTNARLARTGSLVHFQNPNHISMVYKPDFVRGNPLLFSFGSEHGPQLYRLQDEHGWHPGSVVLLNVQKL